MSGFASSPFEALTIYSEVLQDSAFELMDAGKVTFASGASITLSRDCQRQVLDIRVAAAQVSRRTRQRILEITVPAL